MKSAFEWLQIYKESVDTDDEMQDFIIEIQKDVQEVYLTKMDDQELIDDFAKASRLTLADAYAYLESRSDKKTNYGEAFKFLAQMNYLYADAMIAERNKDK